MGVVKSSRKLQFTLAACSAGVVGAQAGAAVVYNAVDLTISSAGPRTSGSIMLPAIGITSDDSRGGATFTPTTGNGVRLTKPSVSGVSIAVGTDGSYPSGAPIDTLVTAFSAGTPVAYTGSSSPYSVTLSNPLLLISEDGTYGNFPVSSGVKYVAINYTSSQFVSGANYNGWVEYQTTSVGSTVSAHITGVAFESTLNTPIVTGDRGAVNTWVPTTSGSFGTASNWSAGSVPSGPGASVLFDRTIAAPSTVTLANNTTVGILNINSPVAYTIDGAGKTLTLDGGAIPATLRVASGSHTVAAPITLGSNSHVSIEVGSKLTTTTIDGAKTLTVTGGGVLVVPNRLSATTLTVLSNSLVDIQRGAAVLTGATESAVRTLVTNWRNTGVNGIGSTAGDPLATLGVITNTNGKGGALYSSFDGLSTPASAILVKYTYIGDTDLNGYVDANDLANLLAGMNGKLTGWLNGDLNYDGKVDATDYNLLVASLNGQGAPYGDPGGASVGAVPEPTSLSLLAMGAVGLAAYRKRNPAAA